jgi:hypothetical protein
VQESPPEAAEQLLTVAPDGLVAEGEIAVFCGSVDVRVTVHVLLLGTGAGWLQLTVGAVAALG